MHEDELVNTLLKKLADKYVRKTCLGLNEVEMEEGIYNFEQYLHVLWDIMERLEREGRELPRFEIDKSSN